MTDRVILTPYFLDDPLPGLRSLMQDGWALNANDPQGKTQLDRVGSLQKPLAAFVEATLNQGDRPVSIAGDCLSAIGVTAGIQLVGIEHQLIWFDAHGDFNTWETSPSGFLGGMPLAMLVGRGEQTILKKLAMQSHPETRVVFTDGRDLDPLEREAMEASDLVHLKNIDDLLSYTLPEIPLHIHFDTDILEPGVAPAMNYLASGGPDLEQLQTVFRHLAATGRILAVSLSSWNPELDHDGRTRHACMQALESLLSL